MRSSYDGAAIRWRDALGLAPADQARAAARAALRGDPYAPSVRFGPSSLRIFKPRISLATWLGRRRPDGLVPVYNLFNRQQPPPGSPYSVKVTAARDFQGGRWTYDSHAGTDFAVPVGTAVVAAAPGMVVRIARELDRGGLDVSVDHGDGLLTTHSHLSRSDVAEGQHVERGEVLGLSGAAGLEFVLFFPLVAPHLHYNTWLDGTPVDPFSVDESVEAALWRTGNHPVPGTGPVPDDDRFAPTAWVAEAVEEHLDLIRDPALTARIRAMPERWQQAGELLYARVFRGPVFAGPGPSLYPEAHPRRPVLDLPFRAVDVRGAALPPVRR